MSDINEIYVGSSKMDKDSAKTDGFLVEIDGESYYKIGNYNRMRPFLMTLTSDSDIWMFISSNGGLTAGRKNADHSIFPYCTDDQLTAQSHNTGSKSVFLVHQNSRWNLWTPFSDTYAGCYNTRRNLYKNSLGNKLIFEEENHDLGLTYRQSWQNARAYGIIKKSELINQSNKKVEIRLLDGVENLMPPGILQNVQQTKSNLANAYKKGELLQESGIGIYSLSSNIIDRPEPSESLKATAVWSAGLQQVNYLLSSLQVHDFIAGLEVSEELEMRAEPGAYFVSGNLKLEVQQARSWYFCIDTDLNAVEISALQAQLRSQADLTLSIEKAISDSSENLKKLISGADGFQLSADTAGNFRHLSNTLFNLMRGGTYANGYRIEKSGFLEFVQSKNKRLFSKNQAILEQLPDEFHVHYIKELFSRNPARELVRFAYEFLPITFSRRHGDPSRPWNKFNIDVLRLDGSWKQNFEGNWRDIFQNWEALSYSFPEFTESTITLFLNASTIDGYNPYRITSNGIEWEIADPEDPWSFIGYWGDHQIIYLLKLLEISVKFHPQDLVQFLDQPFFTYANVPYRLKGYDDICSNPYSTIVYDEDEEKKISDLCKDVGADGKLVWHRGEALQASLTEKLLLTLLTKLSNFVPEGGIWMNTQRPEWNDANNALVGHGLSVVTVCHIRRYLAFLIDFYIKVDQEEFRVGLELHDFFTDISQTFEQNISRLTSAIDHKDRKRITDLLGRAGERYRNSVYQTLSGKRVVMNKKILIDFLETALRIVEQTIRANKRSDDLYHAYNLLEISSSEFGIKHLYPMLEGQAAVLTSGFLTAEDSVRVLNSLRASELFRADQGSYILYPNKKLPDFMEKSRVNIERIRNSKLLTRMLDKRDTSIIQMDIAENFYFNESLCNSNELKMAMAKLKDAELVALVGEESQLVLDIYENVFNHHAFTGRSGTFFGYEGLGSIYWHMNSKLLLAVQENYFKAIDIRSSAATTCELKKHYYDIKEGLGVHKSPGTYGAIPTDPYSHTPANKGAQQPGMTGQVKEDVLSRIGELGIQIQDGCIAFQIELLDRKDFLNQTSTFTYYNSEGKTEQIHLKSNELAFTFCGIPFKYSLSEKSEIEILLRNSESLLIKENIIDASTSMQIFHRSPEIRQVTVKLKL